MKLLWLSTRWPFPPDDGAKQASASLLLALAEAGYDISIVTFSRDEQLASSPHEKIRLLAHFRAKPLTPGWRILSFVKSLLGALPLSAVPFSGFGLSWEKLRELSGENPDCVIVDGLHAYASFLGTNCPWKLLYRAHNHEASLWRQAGSRHALPSRPFFFHQAEKMESLETELCLAAKRIAAISQEDASEFRSMYADAKVGWVPMAYQFSPPPRFPSGPLTFGYLGRLDWPPNREGLQWFLKNIWPEVKKVRPEFQLIVAGSGNGEWLQTQDSKNFDFLGRVEQLEDFYRKVHATIAPIHYGSGTKIKVLEAARFARSGFITPQALKGSGLASSGFSLVSEEARDWIKAMVSCEPMALEAAGKRLFTEASSLYGYAEASSRFLPLLS